VGLVRCARTRSKINQCEKKIKREGCNKNALQCIAAVSHHRMIHFLYYTVDNIMCNITHLERDFIIVPRVRTGNGLLGTTEGLEGSRLAQQCEFVLGDFCERERSRLGFAQQQTQTKCRKSLTESFGMALHDLWVVIIGIMKVLHVHLGRSLVISVLVIL
jgi:hypothetical protein